MMWFFLILSILLIFLAVLVIGSVNPVHSVCYLILIYLLSSIVLFIIGYDFLAIIYIIVYIGAIMVLFLFIIMMLNIRLIEMRSLSLMYLPIGLVFLLVLVYSFYLLIFKLGVDFNYLTNNLVLINNYNVYVEWLLYINYKMTNIHYIGLFLYNKYSLLLIICGFLLFIATIGAILISYILLKDFVIKIKKNDVKN